MAEFSFAIGVREVRSPGHQPRPVQRPLPIAVGAMTAPGLRVAARWADIVAFAGPRQVRGTPSGTFIGKLIAAVRRSADDPGAAVVCVHGPLHRLANGQAEHGSPATR